MRAIASRCESNCADNARIQRLAKLVDTERHESWTAMPHERERYEAYIAAS